jgi:hypothetical protein
MAKKAKAKSLVKEIVISRGATMEMVVFQTPIKGVKTRTGKQAYTSVTKHRKRK